MKKDHQRKNVVEYYLDVVFFFVYPVQIGMRLICFMRTPFNGTQTRFIAESAEINKMPLGGKTPRQSGGETPRGTYCPQ